MSRVLGLRQADEGQRRSAPAGLALTYLFPHSVWLSEEIRGGGAVTLKIHTHTPGIRAMSIGLKTLFLQSRVGLRAGPWGLGRDTQRCYKIISIDPMPG